jgi:adenosylcobinamide-phosphate synthase
VSAESTFAALALALCIDAAFGYPDAVYRAIGHPVTWIGWLIGRLDTLLNRSEWSLASRRLAGVLALGVFIAVPVVLALWLQQALLGSLAGLIILAIVASTLIASRSLYDHVSDVAKALEVSGEQGGRDAVAKIVGRDPQALDEHGVARAAIESLAENASDGVVAPVFWFAVLGLPGLAAYKAINTADSMIGHRTPRHEAFGWASAKFDDLVNLPASRLTGLLFAAAAVFLPGGSPRDALSAMARDASKHRSPNAGWPESAMAGALGLKLNGPRSYGGVPSADAYMGDGRAEATAGDISRALSLAGIAWALMFALVIAGYIIARS